MRGQRLFLWVLLAAAFAVGCATVPSGTVGGGSGVEGRVVLKESGAPVPGAFVYVYRDWGKNFIGVSDYLSRGADAQGNFRIEVPPGRYGVVARKRGSGASYGPLSTGDQYDNRVGEPAIEVVEGKYSRVDLALVTMKEPMFFKHSPEEVTDTGIRGRILDEQGNPIPGAFAVAYTGADMKRLPDFASSLTNDDGRFTLYLPAGGKFWIAARVHIRDMPRPDEPYGMYEGTPDHSLEVAKGSFAEGVDLTVRPFKGTYIPGKIKY